MAETRTFQGVIDRLTTTVQRDDLLSSYLNFTNQAVRNIAERYSFPEMRATGAGTVAVGQTRAALPSDFKELQNGRYPVFDTPVGGTGSLVPVFIRQEVEKLLPAGLIPAASYIYTQDFTGGTPVYTLSLPFVATVIHNFVLYYFAYPGACTDPVNPANNTTPLIEKYFDMVLNKSLSLAFQSINDPIYLLHEKQFLLEYQLVTGEDVTRALRALHPVKG